MSHAVCKTVVTLFSALHLYLVIDLYIYINKGGKTLVMMLIINVVFFSSLNVSVQDYLGQNLI